jgi:hypothetical protein
MNKHLNIHAIGFRRNMITCPDQGQKNREEVENLQYLLMRFGYVLSEQAATELAKADTLFIEQYSEAVNELLEFMIGSKRGYTLQDIYELEIPGVRTSFQSYLALLYTNKFDPKKVEAEKVFTEEHTILKVIDYANIDKFKSIFTKLVAINTAITPIDFAIVEWFAGMYGSENVMPKEIPFKENLCMLAALMMDVPVKTSTDVLRIAMYLSNGHTELRLPSKLVRTSSWSTALSPNPERDKFKFKSFARAQRRYLLGLLDTVAQEKEMVLKIGQWLRLGEKLHPGDYKGKFPRAFTAFDNLRNNPVYSWYSEVNKAFNRGLDYGLIKLSERPGEFGRRIDALLRNNTGEDRGKVLTKFTEVASKISSKVLWELFTHFSNRTTQKTSRFITIPGARRPTALPILEPMKATLVDEVQMAIFEGLKTKFKDLDPLGAVYLDEKLKDIPAPTNMRTLNDSLHAVVRGTRIPLDKEKKVLRMFMYWTAGVDLDLSAAFYKDGGKTKRHCAYTEVKPTPYIKHSGDVRPSQKGEWREYIDIKLDENEFDYAILSVKNFNGGPMNTQGGKAGIAEFDNDSPGDGWLAKAVTTAYATESQSSTIVLLAIDFKNMEWILIDQDQAGVPIAAMQDSTALLEYFITEPTLSVYDILKMHVEVRGNQVTEIEDAEVVWLYDEFCTSYEKVAGYML